ncbi:MAG: hypothetical protein JWQ21_4054, partial [Herminiimonas sp.]|nr:hypothetical protein [Herminiimonas sp.]
NFTTYNLPIFILLPSNTSELLRQEILDMTLY